MPKIYDVTVPLSAEVPTFPGDPRFQLDFSHRISAGEPYNVARLTFGAHSGTHVDAPYHFLADGATVDQLPLELLIGRARVVEMTALDRIERADLERAGARVLGVIFNAVDATSNPHYGSYMYSPYLKDWYDSGSAFAHDVAGAEKLLDEAGWRKGTDGKRAKDGQPARLPVLYPAPDVLRKELALAAASPDVVALLKAAGAGAAAKKR